MIVPLIREAVPDDVPDLLRMRHALLPDEEHEAETARYFECRATREVILVAAEPGGSPIGFVEVGQRSFAEGCESSPVAYVEGWYVDTGHRRQGVGRALFAAAERWARAHEFSEIASDAVVGNDVSIVSHTNLGYEEVVRIVCFRRSIL